MSNIEPLLNAVDTLVELIREYDDAQSRTEEEALIESINSQADYISGMIAMYRAINKTNQPIMKSNTDSVTIAAPKFKTFVG